MTIELSYSQLQNYDRCKFQWYLSYNQGWKPKEKPRYFDLGSKIHEALETWYKTLSWDKVLALGSTWVTPEMTDEDLQNVDQVLYLMDRYVHEFVPANDTDWDIKAVEYKFEVPVTTPAGRLFTVRGYIDLVIEVFGKYWGVEHKSHSGRPYTEDEISMEPQFAFYQGALATQGIELFGTIYNLFNTYQHKDRKKVKTEQLFKRLKAYRTPEEVNSIMTEIGEVADDLFDRYEYNVKESFPYYRSLKRDCTRCQFMEPCLLNLKGVPLDEAMEAGFEKENKIIAVTT